MTNHKPRPRATPTKTSEFNLKPPSEAEADEVSCAEAMENSVIRTMAVATAPTEEETKH